MKCEGRGQRVVDLTGTKAEVEKTEVRFTAGIAERRGSTWRGPPEMTALRQDITASPYRTFLLLSLIGLLLQIHSATGKCYLWKILSSIEHRLVTRINKSFYIYNKFIINLLRKLWSIQCVELLGGSRIFFFTRFSSELNIRSLCFADNRIVSNLQT